MMQFIRENWLWIVLPFVLVLGGLAVLIVMSNTGDDSAAPFQYNVF